MPSCPLQVLPQGQTKASSPLCLEYLKCRVTFLDWTHFWWLRGEVSSF